MAAPAEVLEPRRRLPAGWRIVAGKEIADHLLSARFAVLLVLLGLVAAGTVYAASGPLREAAAEASDDAAPFLALFTLAPENVPSFLSLVGFLAPLLGIALGFDAVNGERAQGTLPRLLSQPIHRDDVVNGKFVAGIAVIGLLLAVLTVIVAGVGIVRLGVVPSVSEALRLVIWLLVTIMYISFWQGFATLCSVAFRRAATSALVTIGVWLLFTLFDRLLAGLLADAIAPVPDEPTSDEVVRNARLEQNLARVSPSTLYDEATLVLLDPEVRSIGVVLLTQIDRAVRSSLSLEQSLLLAWPQTVGLVALTVVSFAAAYVLFMRQEVRA
jgi:ABC-2 type transport system permease protein